MSVHEQIRRDARERLDATRTDDMAQWDGAMVDLAEWAVENLDALLAELEQAELEIGRDHNKLNEQAQKLGQAEARLAKVPALVEALTEIRGSEYGSASGVNTDRLIATQALRSWETNA